MNEQHPLLFSSSLLHLLHEASLLPPDLTLVTSTGLVRTHSSILALTSPTLSATLSPSHTVVSLPDLTKEAVDKLLGLFTARWEEVEVGREEEQVVRLLHLPIAIGSPDKQSEVKIKKEPLHHEKEPFDFLANSLN